MDHRKSTPDYQFGYTQIQRKQPVYTNTVFENTGYVWREQAGSHLRAPMANPGDVTFGTTTFKSVQKRHPIFERNDPTGIRNGETFVQERYKALVNRHFLVLFAGVVGIFLLLVDILLQKVIFTEESDVCCNTVILILPFIANAVPITAAMSGNGRSAMLSAILLVIAFPAAVYVALVDETRFNKTLTLLFHWLLVVFMFITFVFTLRLINAINTFKQRTALTEELRDKVQTAANLLILVWVFNQLLLLCRIIFELFVFPDEVSVYRNTILLTVPFIAMVIPIAFARTGSRNSTIFGLVLLIIGALPLVLYTALLDTRRFEDIVYLIFEWILVAFVFLMLVAVIRFFLALSKYRNALKSRGWKIKSLQT